MGLGGREGGPLLKDPFWVGSNSPRTRRLVGWRHPEHEDSAPGVFSRKPWELCPRLPLPPSCCPSQPCRDVFCVHLCLFGQGLGQGLGVRAVVRKWGWGAPPGWTGWPRVLRQWAREGPGARPRAGKGRLKDKHRPARGHELGLQRGWQTLPVAHGAPGRSGQSGGGQRPEVVSRESDSQWRAPGSLSRPRVLALPSCSHPAGRVIPTLHMGILRQGGMCPRPHS